MKLFLASQDLGNHAEILREMVNDKNRALVISNARDYYSDEARIAASVEKTLINLAKLDIKAERLDLRKYFGKSAELTKLIQEKEIGLIFSIGGSVTCLATALHASGMDEIIRDGVAKNQFVYGGYSAGSMVASNDLSLYQLEAKPNEEVPIYFNPNITQDIYHLAPHMRGLGLLSQYIVPHMDRTDHIDVMQRRLEQIKQAGATAICLNDPDVVTVSNNQIKVLKG